MDDLRTEKQVVLRVEDLRKTYPSGEATIPVLKGVNLIVRGGESVSIQGESGSGKTTLVHLAAGLDLADSGAIYWEETDITKMRKGSLPRRRGAFLGMVFQSFHLAPELTALENILLAARLVGRSVRTVKERAENLLERVGLAERGHHVPAQLSGGEQQRVALARALINRPRMVLADEPTGNLDERTGDRILELLLENCREEGTSLLLVTHNKVHAGRTDRQLFLHYGQMQPEFA
ncbi:MAG: ABC transporter ATP-binding protein [Opitutales bacterium]|nr:ABC transporter ATP-binding protein [Opitutales bacterium]MCH8540090.1 ABC transporter ATP-binding protein [Opitutales bacterium]